MKNTSDYLMLGLLLICMRYDKKVCYKMWDYNWLYCCEHPTGYYFIWIINNHYVMSEIVCRNGTE